MWANNSMQRTALRAAADAERWTALDAKRTLTPLMERFYHLDRQVYLEALNGTPCLVAEHQALATRESFNGMGTVTAQGALP